MPNVVTRGVGSKALVGRGLHENPNAGFPTGGAAGGTLVTRGVGSKALVCRGLSPAGTTPVAADFLSALKAYLLSMSSLSTLTRVSNRLAPEGQAYPHMVLNVISETPIVTTNRDVLPTWAEVQFSVLDSDDQRGLSLAWAAWLSLAPNNSPALVFDGGADSGGHLPGLIREIRMPGTGRGGKPCWAFIFCYRFYLTRPLHN